MIPLNSLQCLKQNGGNTSLLLTMANEPSSTLFFMMTPIFSITLRSKEGPMLSFSIKHLLPPALPSFLAPTENPLLFTIIFNFFGEERIPIG